MTLKEAKDILVRAGYKVTESHVPGYDPEFGGNDVQSAWNKFAELITSDSLFIDHLLVAWNAELMDEFVTYVAGVEV
jgi:hypothetical protein